MNDRSRVDVVEVRDKAGLKTFIDVPWRVFADDPVWVPPLRMERAEVLNPEKNPFFAHAEVAMWVALVDGVPSGRISAQIDRRYLARHDKTAGHFGFFDSIASQPVAEALLKTAEDWLAERGMSRVLGPFSFSVNDECGLLVDGFETPPMVMMGHARPYYDDMLKTAGYTKARDLLAFLREGNSPPTPKVQRLIDRARNDPRISFRPLRWKHFDRDIASILEIFNDAWADNWGFIPFGDAEMRHLAKELKLIIEEDFVCIADVDGKPAAFALILPDMNEAMRDLNGRLLPFGWARLLYRLKMNRIHGARVPLMGVRKSFQSTPLGAVLAYTVINGLYEAQMSRAFNRYEMSWILEENLPVQKIIEAVGGRVYKTYRIYEKALG